MDKWWGGSDSPRWARPFLRMPSGFLNRQIKITIISLALALVVAAALAFLLARHLSRPVRQLGDTVRELSRGEYQARVSIETRDEVAGLAEHVNQLAGTLEKNRTARQRWMADYRT